MFLLRSVCSVPHTHTVHACMVAGAGRRVCYSEVCAFNEMCVFSEVCVCVFRGLSREKHLLGKPSAADQLTCDRICL